MSKEIEEATDWMRSLTSIDRARFLAALSHNLTITGRMLAHSSAADALHHLEQMRQLNEIQHRLSSYIYYALGTDEDTVWLPIVITYVYQPKDALLRRHAASEWAGTQSQFLPSM
jgi:hypothetical protein